MPIPLIALLALGLGGEAIVSRGRQKGGFLEDVLGESRSSRQGRERTAQAEQREQLISGLQLPQGISSNEFDLAVDRQMSDQFDQALALLKSPDPNLRAVGAREFSRLQAAATAATQENEAQFRVDLEHNRTADIDRGNTATTRALTMNRQLQDDLEPVAEAQVGFDKLNNAMDVGDFLNSQVALISMIQSIDGSVVRSEELRNFQSANGLLQGLINAFNRAEGANLSPETVQSVRNAGAALMNAEVLRARALTEGARMRANAFGLDETQVLAGVDPRFVIEKPTVLTPKVERAPRQLTPAPGGEPGGLSEFVAGQIRGASVLGSNVGAILREETLVMDRQTEEFFWQDKDGNLRPISPIEEQARRPQFRRHVPFDSLERIPDAFRRRNR